MAYRDLRDFIDQLERDGELVRVRAEVDPNLEMTAFCDRVLRKGGPAILFERPKGAFRAPSGATIPVLGNLFGTPGRVARAMGADPANWRESLREVFACLNQTTGLYFLSDTTDSFFSRKKFQEKELSCN